MRREHKIEVQFVPDVPCNACSVDSNTPGLEVLAITVRASVLHLCEDCLTRMLDEMERAIVARQALDERQDH